MRFPGHAFIHDDPQVLDWSRQSMGTFLTEDDCWSLVVEEDSYGFLTVDFNLPFGNLAPYTADNS